MINIANHTSTQPPTLAEQMLPTPHIDTYDLGVGVLPPDAVRKHTAYVINAENDFLNQGVDPRLLIPGIGTHITLREQARENTSDQMTGLLNTKGLDVWFDRYKPEKFVVIFADARKFGQINKVYGHAMGDRVIKFLGETMASRFRVGKADDCQVEKRADPKKRDAIAAGIGRRGGDEFEIVVDASSIPDDAEVERVFMDLLTARLDNLGVYKKGKVKIPISMRSVAMIGRSTDKKPLNYYKEVLDPLLSELTKHEKYEDEQSSNLVSSLTLSSLGKHLRGSRHRKSSH